METKDLELEKILSKYHYAGISVIHTTKDEIDYIKATGEEPPETTLGINTRQ